MVGLLGLLGLALAAVAMLIYIPARNALDLDARRYWGSELYMANIRQLESPVYLSTAVCESDEDPPYLFASIPSSLDAARAGIGAVAFPETKQLLRRRGSLKVDGIEWVAVEARQNGQPFRGWLRARSCGGAFASEYAQSGLFTPIRGPWTEDAHRAMAEWISYEDRYRDVFLAALRHELAKRGVRIREETTREIADRGLSEKYTDAASALESDAVFTWDPVVREWELKQTGFLPKNKVALIRNEDLKAFRAAVDRAVYSTIAEALELRGSAHQRDLAANKPTGATGDAVFERPESASAADSGPLAKEV